jgi:acyl-CoA thioesterase-2
VCASHVSMQASADPAILDAFEGLLRVLNPEPLGDDRFRLTSERDRFDRVFGGQAVAQALLTAGSTVVDHDPHSLHAYFVEGGDLGQPLEAAVDRVRDGRTMATRRVALTQDDRTVLVAIASFHTNPTDPAVTMPMPVVPPPEDLPTLQDWARAAPDPVREQAVRLWVDHPPPLDIRIGEALTFMGGAQASNPRSHWLRPPRGVGDDPLLNAVLLAYASDYFLQDMAMRTHPERSAWGVLGGFSLDHTIWFHRRVHFDRWHLYTHETLAIVGHRGLVRGSLHDEGGALVATVVQEVLARPLTTRS